MSELSPGSKTTTNIFMVLGALALLALVIVQNLTEAPRQPGNCDARIIAIEPFTGEAGGNPAVHTAIFRLLPNGEIRDISVSGNNAVRTQLSGLLTRARFAPAPGDSEVWCTYTFPPAGQDTTTSED